MTKTKGIREEQRALRERIAKWHTANGNPTWAKTAQYFCVSEFLVRKALEEAIQK